MVEKEKSALEEELGMTEDEIRERTIAVIKFIGEILSGEKITDPIDKGILDPLIEGLSKAAERRKLTKKE